MPLQKLFINKKFKNRHKILEVLTKHYYDNEHHNNLKEDLLLSFDELEKLTNLDSTELRSQLGYLENENEIYHHEYRHISHYGITTLGIVAFNDNLYITNGKEILNNKLKVSFIILTFIITIISLVISCN